MVAVCKKCRFRDCPGCGKEAKVLAAVSGLGAMFTRSNPQLVQCAGRTCKTSLDPRKMARFDGELFCPDCHADLREIACTTCDTLTRADTMRRKRGRLVCSDC